MSASDLVIIRCSKHESGINELEMRDIPLQARVSLQNGGDLLNQPNRSIEGEMT